MRVIFSIGKRLVALYGIERARRFKIFRLFVRQVLAGGYPDHVTVDGHVYYIDDVDSLGLARNGEYEPYITRVLHMLIEPGSNVFDIGANIGYFSLVIGRLVGSTGRVYCFEPDPSNFSLLQKNVTTNKYEHIECFEAAISDATGQLELYLSEDNQADHRLYFSNEGRASVKVDSLALGMWKPEVPIAFIKMDIQGAERRAFAGMAERIKRDKPSMVIEFWPYGIEKAGDQPEAVLEFLEENNYVLYQVDEDTETLDIACNSELVKNYTANFRNWTTLVCVHSDNHKAVQAKLDRI